MKMSPSELTLMSAILFLAGTALNAAPAGNHFFAYAIKDTVMEWLNPKPITYQNQGSRWITFDGYLQK